LAGDPVRFPPAARRPCPKSASRPPTLEPSCRQAQETSTASIVQQIEIDAPAEDVWDAVADFGAVHRRFAPGFVVDTKLEPSARIVTFANGLVAREHFVSRDDDARRLVYSVRTERFDHHNGAFQVADLGGGRCRLTWTADLLPDAMAPTVAGMMEQGLKVAQGVLGRVPA
jgi:carbon monoxide dehydrogenase subunit G